MKKNWHVINVNLKGAEDGVVVDTETLTGD